MIFVTGGTGLVGSHLLAELIRTGEKVRALKREHSNTDYTRKVITGYYKMSEKQFNQVEWVTGDILDIHSMFSLLEGVDYIYHCAAIVSFSSSDKNLLLKTNAEGTANLVNAAIEHGIKKFCYVSSVGTLGRNKKDGLTTEEHWWKESNTNSVYSVSKYRAEQEVLRASAEGLDVIIVNPSVILGPGNWDKGSSQFFSTVWKGLHFYTKGINGFVDVTDVIKIMKTLMESGITNELFIISSENLAYRTFLNLISRYLDKPQPSVYIPPLLSHLGWRYEKIKSLISGSSPLVTEESARTAHQNYQYSHQKIRDCLNYTFMPVEDSIKKTCEFFLKDIRDGNKLHR
jgi:dihydroflavonol-4-reductase